MINPNTCGMYLCMKCWQYHTLVQECPIFLNTTQILIKENYII